MINDTKQNILSAALRLFSQDGYEAVSVSQIAGQIGMTKGALYKHYKNKQNIFDCIVGRMYKIDHEKARENKVPEKSFSEAPQSYQKLSLENIGSFMLSQFRFWNEDEFACNFRKMLTLEQYRNQEMAKLLSDCIIMGPIKYTEDMFIEMMKQGELKQDNPQQLALELFSPFYLLLCACDTTLNKEQSTKLLSEHINRFTKKHTQQGEQNV